MGDTKARTALRERLEIDLDPRVRRRIRETLRDLTEPRRAPEAIREELEKLQGEHSDLKARLAALEARVGGSSESKRVEARAKGKARAPGARNRGRKKP